MSFNYGYEKKLFDKEWQKKQELMKSAGMSDDDIKKIYDFDWSWFKSIRSYQSHTINLNISHIPDDRTDFEKNLEFMEQIENKTLLKAIKSLSQKDLNLLIQIVVEDKNQSEIAKDSGIYRSSIHYQLKKIKKQIKSFFNI